MPATWNLVVGADQTTVTVEAKGEFTPEEADRLAKKLLNKADEARKNAARQDEGD